MKTGSAVATQSTSHVEAFCCTGSSPGRTAHARISFPLTHGGAIETRIGYEVHGPAHAAPIVVLGGISAGRHLAPTALDPSPGWWPGVIRRGGALDTERHRLLGIDYLGGPEARTTGAYSETPISSQDQARAIATVLDEAGIDRVTLIGSSYGGMVALAFASLFPSRTRRVIAICAAHRTHPLATAWRSIQRRTVRFATDHDCPDHGLALARSLAMTTYRSAAEFDARFEAGADIQGGTVRFPVESYLEARGADFAEKFTPRDFLSLSESIDLHAVNPAEVLTQTTLVSFDTDTLVPPWLVEELTDSLRGPARHIALTSVFGHDAFLKEVDAVSGVICEALGGTGVVR